MDSASVIAKSVGSVLLILTVRSIYKHFWMRHIRRKFAVSARSKTGAKVEHSKLEAALNVVLIYAWFTFMTVFSVGLIVNN